LSVTLFSIVIKTPNISTKKIAAENKISQQSMYISKRQKFHLYKTHYVQELDSKRL